LRTAVILESEDAVKVKICTQRYGTEELGRRCQNMYK
jgi:hypothetical protein